MALTRKFLAALGIDADKIDEIIDAHVETVDALKADKGKLQAEVDELPELRKKVEELSAGNKESFKVKYEALKEEYEKFKKDAESREVTAAKETAYKQLLKDAGVSDKRIDSIIKVTDMNDIALDDDGKIVDANKLTKSIKEEWADFIVQSSVQGANTATPPANNGGNALTKEQIYARDEKGNYKMSTSERQEALMNLAQSQSQI